MYPDPVKVRVDSVYPQYLAEATRTPGAKILPRLNFVRMACNEMLKEGDEATRRQVKKRAKEDDLDMPEQLLEVQDSLGEEEIKRYFKNHR